MASPLRRGIAACLLFLAAIAGAMAAPRAPVVSHTAYFTTTVVVATSGTPSVAGNSVTYTGSAGDGSLPTPQGYMDFYDGTAALPGCVDLLTTPSAGNLGKATCTVSPVVVGAHSITMVFHNGNAPFNGPPQTTAAITQTVTSLGAGPQLDAEVHYSDSLDITSPLFSTTVNPELIVVFFASRQAGGPSPTLVPSVGGLTFTKATEVNVAYNGREVIWYAQATAIYTNISVTVKGAWEGNLWVEGFTGFDTTTPIGATSTSNNGPPPPDPNVTCTTTKNNGWVWAAGSQNTGGVALAAGGGNQFVDEYTFGFSQEDWIERETAATPVGGTAVTISTSNGGWNWAMACAEVRPSGVAAPVAAFGTGTHANPQPTSHTLPPISSTTPNEVFIAFIDTNGPTTASNLVTSVTGGGLTWTKKISEGTQYDGAEVWWAVAAAPVTNMLVTYNYATATTGGLAAVTAWSGVDPVTPLGASVSGNNTTGAPSVNLATTRNNSWVWGAGADWDSPTSHTPGAGQAQFLEELDPSNDSYWIQRRNAPTPLSGTSVTISSTAPVGDRWDLVAVEIMQALTASTTTLTSSANPISPSQTTTYTATVTPAAPVPTGTVVFKDGVTPIAGCNGVAVNGAGVATCSPAAYGAVGSHSITATYSGDGTYDTSVSAPVTQNVVAWEIQASPNTSPGQNNELSAVACASSTVCWAVGYYQAANGHWQPLMERWDGTSWSVVASPSTSITDDDKLYGVGCASPTLCWAVGHYNNGSWLNLIEKWDGVSWTIDTAPNPGGSASNVLDSVSCPSVTLCMVGGFSFIGGFNQTVIEHWNGATWSLDSTPNSSATQTNDISGISCPSTTSCWTVGLFNNGTTDQTEVLHWDGATWTIVPSPNTSAVLNNELHAVSCVSVTLCYGVGYATNGSAYQPLVERWNGATWSIVATPSAGATVDQWPGAISCVSASDCTVAGSYLPATGSVQPFALHWDGSTWTITPSTSTSISQDNWLDGVACPASGLCFASGGYNDGVEDQTLIERLSTGQLTGSSATAVSSANPSKTGQSVTYTATVTPVGVTGTVTFYDGAAVISGCAGIALNGAGVATCTPALYGTPGSHSITAAYHGDATYGVSTSAPFTQTVNKAATTTGLTSSANPASTGDAPETVVYTATASVTAPGSGNATGTVTFMDDGSNIAGCVGVALVAGAATCTTTYAVPGVIAVTATYGGDAAVNGSTSPPLSETIDAWTFTAGENQGPNLDNYLYGVDCANGSNCFAVGYYDNAGTNQTLIEHWDGSAWLIVASPNSSAVDDNVLKSVSCPSATSCWAVGYRVTAGIHQTLVEHWDGTSWSITASPNVGSNRTNYLWSVSCPTTTMCAAAGWADPAATDQTLIEQWNGAVWSIVVSPNTSPTEGNYYFGVDCFSATMCQAVGGNAAPGQFKPLIHIWNGATWTASAVPSVSGTANHDVFDVSCPTATYCKAVGEYKDGGGYQTLGYVWNGATWTLDPTADITGNDEELTGVDCVSTTYCWAAGDYDGGTRRQTLAEQWDGNPWFIQLSPDQSASNYLYSTACPTAGDCWMVGYETSTGNSNVLIEHLGVAGAVTSTTDLNASANPVVPGQSLTYTAHAYGAGPIATGTVTFRDGGLAIAGCTAVALDVTGEALCTPAAYGSPGDHIITAVYSGDTTFATSTSAPLTESVVTWAISPAPAPGTAGQLHGVACLNVADCFAVGSYTTGGVEQTLIERWDGTSWTAIASPNSSALLNNELLAVDCAGPGDCWATGDRDSGGGIRQTLIEHWDGSSWSIAVSANASASNNDLLLGVTCTGPTFCVAAGSDTTPGGLSSTLILTWDGSTWSLTASPNQSAGKSSLLLGIDCASATVCVAAGDYCTLIPGACTNLDHQPLILEWNGASWSVGTEAAPPGPAYLSGVACPTTLECLVSRDYYNGTDWQTLAETWDGLAWTVSLPQNTSPVRFNSLRALTCTSHDSCWGVGLSYSGAFYNTLAESWNGSAWTRVSSPNSAATDQNDLEGITCVSATDCWAVGNFDAGAGKRPLIIRLGQSTATASTTAVTASANPSATGQAVTYTATITPAAPVASGTVTFYDGASAIAGCSGIALNGSGQASCAGPAYSATGSHSITAVYSGDLIYAASASGVLTQTVGVAATTTTIGSSANPANTGASVTFMATVAVTAPGAGTPTGSVDFKDGAAIIGSGTIAAGIATYTTTSLSAGPHTMTAVYSGTAALAGSASTPLVQTIVSYTSATSLPVSSSNPSAYGSSVTFTTTVSGGSGTPVPAVLDNPFATSAVTPGILGNYMVANRFVVGAPGVDVTSASITTTAVPAGPNNHIQFAIYTDAGLAPGALIASGPSTVVTVGVSSAPITATLPPGEYWLMYNADGTGIQIPYNTGGAGVEWETARAFGTWPAAAPAPTGTGSFALAMTINGTRTIPAGAVLGNTSIYADTDTGAGNTFSASRITTGDTPVDVSAIHPYFITADAAPNNKYQVAIYSDSGNAPANRLAFSGDNTITVGAWNTAPLSVSLAAGTTYWIVVNTNAVSLGGDQLATDVVDVNNPYEWAPAGYGTWPATAGGVSSSHVAKSLYADVSATVPTGTVDFTSDGSALCTGVALVAGAAGCSTSALAVGTHAIVAAYGGDASHLGSTSPTLTQTVSKAAPAGSLGSSVNPSLYTQSVTLTATINPSGTGATPTGSVDFRDGGSLLATVALSGGTAALTTAALATGAHAITVDYSGDGSYQAVVAIGSLTQTVNPAASAITNPGSTLNPSAVGQSVTFDVTVSGPGAMPTGTVNWFDGASPLGSSGVNIAGVATFTTAGLSPGAHPISATYTGDGDHLPVSTATPLTQTVNAAAPVLSVPVSSVNPSTYGQSVTFTETVSGPGPVPTGTVDILADGIAIPGCSAIALVAGSAGCTTSGLNAGSLSITATYSGDSNYGGGASAALTQTVNQATPVVAVPVSSANPSSYSQNVTFTVNVSGAGTVPTGTVRVFNGAIAIAVAPLDGAGNAAVSTATLQGGPHSITATYLGDANYISTTSAAMTQTVNAIAPVVATPVSTLNPSTFAASVTLSTNVSGAGATPTASVTFFDGVTSLGTVALDGAGNASVTTSALTVGAHSITAAYSGDANYTPLTSAALTQTVNQAATATALASAINPSGLGQTTTLTATVAGPGGTPTGSVDFFDGATPLGTVALVAGSAALPASFGTAGTHTLTAVYSGDAVYVSSTSAPLSQTVNSGVATVPAPSSTLNPSTYGQSVTFSVTITGPGVTPTGTVTFFEGPTSLGVVAMVAGSASLSTATLVVGVHSITATYSGDGNYASAVSAALSQTVSQDTPVVALISSLNPSTYTQAVTFTATVSGGGATPTGTVGFFDGATLLGTSGLAAGTAAFTTAPNQLGGGSLNITAQYNGNANYAVATSPILTQIVNTASVTITTPLSSSNPSAIGQAVTFSVTVTGSGAAPGGTVDFYDGVTLAGSGAVSGAGTATLTTSALALGSHSITGTYSGDANYAGTTSAVLTQTVVLLIPGITAPASSANPSTFGSTVTLTSTVSGSGPAPSGTVDFYDGATNIATVAVGAAGSAQLNIATLTVGSHSITAAYSGDATYATATSAATVQTVTRGVSSTSPVSVSPSPSVFGTPVTLTVNVSGPGGTPGGTVTFYDNGTSVGTGVLNGAGTATITTTPGAPGSNDYTASYSGDSVYLGSGTPSGTVISVGNASTTVTITVTNTNGEVTVIVTVTSSTGATPTGPVTIYDNGTSLGTVTLNNGSGGLTIGAGDLPTGSNLFSATYGGGGGFASSSSGAGVTLTIDPPVPPTPAPSPSPSPSASPDPSGSPSPSASGTVGSVHSNGESEGAGIFDALITGAKRLGAAGVIVVSLGTIIVLALFTGLVIWWVRRRHGREPEPEAELRF